MFSYQLYSSRNFGPLAKTLEMVSKAGYTAVEGYGGLYDKAAALAAALKANHLTMPTGHFGLDMLEHQVDHALTVATTLGVEKIYCPYLMPNERPKDAAGWRAFGARLEKVGAPYRDAGFGFGWHNHDFEFVPLPDGTLPQDAIFAGGPQLEFEMDVSWAIRGGADPLATIAKYGSRITSVHVKDLAPAGSHADEDGWADVGHGTVDWKTIMGELRKIGVKHFVMEHDNPKDDARFASRSIASAKAF